MRHAKQGAIKCSILVASQSEFQVNEDDRHYIVDLELKHCDCRVWDLTGIPCRHAAKAIGYKRHQIEDYVDNSFTKANFLRTYSHKVCGVPDSSAWPAMEDIEPRKILSPTIHRLTGRPKKYRIRETGEQPRVIPSKLNEDPKSLVAFAKKKATIKILSFEKSVGPSTSRNGGRVGDNRARNIDDKNGARGNSKGARKRKQAAEQFQEADTQQSRIISG